MRQAKPSAIRSRTIVSNSKNTSLRRRWGLASVWKAGGVFLLAATCVTATLAGAAFGESPIGSFGEIGVGTSPFRMGGRPVYARDALTFADFDGDGEEEVLTTVTPDDYPRENYLIVINPARGELWRSAPLSAVNRMLVGDIDDDPLPEMVLFGQYQARLKVAQWDGEGVAEAEFDLAGKLGLLADLDGDGTDELLLVRTRVRMFDASRESPSNLLAYDYGPDGFALTHKRELATGVGALTSVDLDGDGRHEVVTSETSFDGDVGGRLSVYRFEPGGAVTAAFRRNGVMERVIFFRAFRSGGADYFFADRGRWKSVFRIWKESGAFRMAPLTVGPTTMSVFEDVFLATAAYSAERGMFFQFAEDDRTRLMSAHRPPSSQ